MEIIAPPFGPALIGQVEKALNALLCRGLTGTGLTESRWVTLTLAVAAPSPTARTDLISHVHRTARFPREEVAEHLTALTASGFLAEDPSGRITVTAEGRSRWSALRASLDQATAPLWAALPPADVAVAERVLTTLLTRADALLTAPPELPPAQPGARSERLSASPPAQPGGRSERLSARYSAPPAYPAGPDPARV
ncbi:hypothetical protein [Actinocorallia sp. A-T 12471]|uniref:hypothetical protein n=1 Tax=Actinocorallia sp. A-T 12471 TaxID=3089813 RepID=UPI0029CB41DD|nr:hypothetical protein [Actinocorallia sp. A-T 12471]MDX6741367.1 hypothetical protein [Actinocorallia sp. A-T 12471]